MVTAAALTVGLALVAFVAVLADGTKATIDQAVSRSFAGDLIVENSQAGNEQGIPALVAPALRAVPGVASVTPIAFTVGRAAREPSNATITAIDPSTFGQRLPGRMEAGLERHAAGARRHAARSLTKGYAERPPPEGGADDLGADAHRSAHVSLTVRGHRRRQRAPARRPHDQPAARARRVRPARRRAGLRLLRPGRRATRRCSPPSNRLLASQLPAGALAHGRAVQAGPGQPDQHAARAHLRAARAVGDRLAVRHRQHADPLDLRAHARAGDDARDRHLAPSGPPDDPLRVGHHRADRRRLRARDRRRRGGPRHDARRCPARATCSRSRSARSRSCCGRGARRACSRRSSRRGAPRAWTCCEALAGE